MRKSPTHRTPLSSSASTVLKPRSEQRNGQSMKRQVARSRFGYFTSSLTTSSLPRSLLSATCRWKSNMARPL